MELTEVSQYKNRKVSGYMLNAKFSKDNQRLITEINKVIKNKFGNIIIAQPESSLHITLMDWVAPLVEYGLDWDVLFKENFPLYDEVLSKQISNLQTFGIIFDTIKVSRAAIYIQGRDDGQFQSLRDGFVDNAKLIPGTKQPPKIIHCTIARFDSQVDVAEIRDFIEMTPIHIEQAVDCFHLVHETEMPMLAYSILKTYPLR